MKDDGNEDTGNGTTGSGGTSNEPPRTVLDQVHALTDDDAPRVLLRDDDGDDRPGSRFVDKQAAGGLRPRGRGNYEIHGEIARGGMGQIIKARDTDLGREVAIKVLDRELAARPFVLRRFVEEAQIGGQLQHPGVVPVYEMGMMEDDLPYFAMKLVKGRTLSALLAQRKTLTEDRRRLLAVFESVCQTMAYAHSKGVVHRDLKPANVMIGSFGEVLVVDWGLAKVVGQGGIADEERARQSKLTVIETVRSGPGSQGSDSVVGSVMGTPAYMPPEQALGEVERLDERADVFALGAILCEILTGDPPYVETEGGERVAVMAAHGRLDAARARIEACEADRALKELCVECLAPAPSVRPRNAEEVARRVHEHLAGLEEKARAAELEAARARVRADGERRARRLTLGLASAVIVALVAIGAALWWTGEQEKAREAETLRGLELTEARVQELQSEGQLEEAVDVARDGLAALTSSEAATTSLRERAERNVGLAEERLRDAVARRALEERNRTLLASLEAIRLDQMEAFRTGNYEPFEERFQQAFRDYGLELTGEDFADEVLVLRENGVAQEISFALDGWAAMRRRSQEFELFDSQKLSMLAMDLDGDPDRLRIREAVLRGEREELLALAHDPEILEVGPELIWTLASMLFDLGHRAEMRVLIDRGARRYPRDFVLQSGAVQLARVFERPDRAVLAAEAAAGLRPDSQLAQYNLAVARWDVGELVRSADAAREAVRLGPEVATARQALGWAEWSLGNLSSALEQLEQAARANPASVTTRLDILAVQYLQSGGDASELLAEIEWGPADLAAQVDWTSALLERDELTRVEAERTLRHAYTLLERAPDDTAVVALCARAALQAGRTAEARDLFERGDDDLVEDNPVTLAELELVGAEVHAQLGDDARARALFDRAQRRIDRLIWLREAEWERSFLLRHRDRAARALGL